MSDDAGIAIAVSIVSLAVSGASFVRSGRWRAQERRETAPRLEVLVRPGYAARQDKSLVLVDVNVIVQNMSTTDVTVTELGIEPVEPAGALLILGNYHNSFAKTVGGGSPFYYTIRPDIFAELLRSSPDLPSEQKFLVYAQSGHGSAEKYWKSEPFPIAESELP